jgi:hypothetical protein
MNALILAAETHSALEPAGDDLQMVAYIMLGVVMLVAAVATWIVTPKADKHH